MLCTLALMLAGPVVLHAQTDDWDRQNSTQYRDVEDGQVLKVVSYILTPVGMALEWGVTRPLHYLATQTSAGPILRGDEGPSFFTENDNASRVPPGTFAPPRINSSYELQANSKTTPATPPAAGSAAAHAKSIPPSKPLISGGQPALR